MMNRRSALAALATSGAVMLAPAPNLNLQGGRRSSALMIACAEAFHAAYNSDDVPGFLEEYASPLLTLRPWGEPLSEAGVAPAAAYLHALRASSGPFINPVSAGEFLADPARATLLLRGQFEGPPQSPDSAIDFIFHFRPEADKPLVRIEIGNTVAPGGLLSVRDHGALGNGTADDSRAVQQAYDALVADGGGTLFFPPGIYRMGLTLSDRSVHLRGSGRNATVLQAMAPGEAVVRALYSSASWSPVTISDLDIVGVGTRQGTGFEAGHDTYRPGDEYAGRTRLTNLNFRNLEKSISRPFGQIGLTVSDCEFDDADFHLWGRGHAAPPGDAMHNGNLLVRNCHFQRAEKAVYYCDSPITGTGQIRFDGCIMESNPGFVFFVRNMTNDDSVPAMLVSNCWNEGNGTAGRTSVDGEQYPTAYAHLRNCGLVRFKDTPLGPLTLINSNVTTEDCALDLLRSVRQDASSTLQHEHARGFGSYAPQGLVLSLTASFQLLPGRALTYVMPHRTHAVSSAGEILMSDDCTSPRMFVGERSAGTNTVDGAILPWARTCQEIGIGAGTILFPAAVNIPAPRWLVWIYSYRLVEGPPVKFQVSGGSGVSAPRMLSSQDWETLVGMTEVADPMSDISLWHTGGAGPSRLRLGGYNLVAFPTRQKAVEFVNSGGFAVRRAIGSQG